MSSSAPAGSTQWPVLALEVPGLAEHRPRLNLGDRAFVRLCQDDPASPETIEYSGVVLSTLRSTAHVLMPEGFWTLYVDRLRMAQ